ncbi:hypothetical protein ACLOJK_004319, partial [Asimina triloba]
RGQPPDYLSPRPLPLVALASWSLAPKLQFMASALPQVEAAADTVLYLLALGPVELLVLATGYLEVLQLRLLI